MRKRSATRAVTAVVQLLHSISDLLLQALPHGRIDLVLEQRRLRGNSQLQGLDVALGHGDPFKHLQNFTDQPRPFKSSIAAETPGSTITATLPALLRAAATNGQLSACTRAATYDPAHLLKSRTRLWPGALIGELAVLDGLGMITALIISEYGPASLLLPVAYRPQFRRCGRARNTSRALSSVSLPQPESVQYGRGVGSIDQHSTSTLYSAGEASFTILLLMVPYGIMVVSNVKKKEATAREKRKREQHRARCPQLATRRRHNRKQGNDGKNQFGQRTMVRHREG